MLEIHPRDRVKYPNLKSLSELKKAHLMPRKNVKPRAEVKRRLYNNYFLYDIELTETYKLSKEEKRIQLKRRREIAASCTCLICGTRYNYFEIKNNLIPFKDRICIDCHFKKFKQYKNPIIYDIETTGLYPESDEILSLSIIDLSGNVLFSDYCRPEHTTSWNDAELINGISYEMVKEKLPISNHRSVINKIIESSDLVVSYNGISFDNKFLKEVGICIDIQPQFDVMKEFSYWIWHEYNDYFKDYKWKKLVDCADYYNYKFEAHDSLEDARATLHCFKCMLDK